MPLGRRVTGWIASASCLAGVRSATVLATTGARLPGGTRHSSGALIAQCRRFALEVLKGVQSSDAAPFCVLAPWIAN